MHYCALQSSDDCNDVHNNVGQLKKGCTILMQKKLGLVAYRCDCAFWSVSLLPLLKSCTHFLKCDVKTVARDAFEL